MSAEITNVPVHFEQEIKKIRAGRPTPEMFENIMVEAYGSMQKLNSVANISIVDATLVTVSPWDKSTVSAVIKGIQAAEGNYNPLAQGDLIRIPIAPMNQEKRLEFVKHLHGMAEEHKVQIRLARKDAMETIDAKKKAGEITEDGHKAEGKKVQDLVDQANAKIDTLVSDKEQQLLTV